MIRVSTIWSIRPHMHVKKNPSKKRPNVTLFDDIRHRSPALGN
jgi:hypothetical protein